MMRSGLGAAIAGAVLLAGCGGSDANGSRLTVPIVGSPWQGGLATQLEAEAVRPTLIARNGAGALVPGLA